MEIERKFLVPQLPGWVSGRPSEEIEQGYLTEEDDSIQIRIRRKDGEFLLGVKLGTGKVRGETEVELTAEQADPLWPLTEGRRLRKTRYLVDSDETTIEVDVFADELGGLVVAEIEFSSVEESERLEVPDWLGRELTGMREFENECLAQHGLPD